jgi:hypothetical protein
MFILFLYSGFKTEYSESDVENPVANTLLQISLRELLYNMCLDILS